MSIFYLNVATVSRSVGRRVIAAASYCSRSKLWDDRRGCDVDFSVRGDLEHSEILLPEGAKDVWSDRATLWNEVEFVEKREDAQLAREIEIVVPSGLSADQAIELAREFFKEQFVARGMIVDLNIHRAAGSDGREHAYVHALFSMREVASGEFGKKRTDWKDSKLLLKWRERWAQLSNKHLFAAGYGRTMGSGASAARVRGLDEFLRGDCTAENFEIAWRNGERLVAEPELALAGLTGRGPTFSREEMVEFVKRNTAGEDQFRMALARLDCSVELVRLAGEERFSTRKLMGSDQAADGAGPCGVGEVDERRPALKESLALWEAAGLRVRGLGLTYELAKKFEKRTGIKSVAVHGLLERWRKKKELLAAGDVLVVDDGAYLSEKQKDWLLKAVRAVSAKLVVVDGEAFVEIDGRKVGLSAEELAALSSEGRRPKPKGRSVAFL